MILFILLIIFFLVTFIYYKNNKKICYINYVIIILLVLYYIWLSVNPLKYNNGNKNNVLEYIKEYVMKFNNVSYNKEIIHDIDYPKIFKPNICSGVSKNVKIINNKEEAINYHKNIKEDYIIQDINYYNNEIGLLYERIPFNKTGKIISIFKREYNNNNIVNIWNVTNKNNILPYTNKQHLITQKLTNKIDEIIKRIPNMYACRLDIKYLNDDDLSNGKNFIILEVNGVMGYDLDFWNINNSFLKKIFIIIRWITIRFFIGICNVIYLNSANPYYVFGKLEDRLLTVYNCKDIEKLFEYVYT
jgi:hypothetical protein